jgi:hypothetical protein
MQGFSLALRYKTGIGTVNCAGLLSGTALQDGDWDSELMQGFSLALQYKTGIGTVN